MANLYNMFSIELGYYFFCLMVARCKYRVNFIRFIGVPLYVWGFKSLVFIRVSFFLPIIQADFAEFMEISLKIGKYQKNVEFLGENLEEICISRQKKWEFLWKN